MTNKRYRKQFKNALPIALCEYTTQKKKAVKNQPIALCEYTTRKKGSSQKLNKQPGNCEIYKQQGTDKDTTESSYMSLKA